MSIRWRNTILVAVMLVVIIGVVAALARTDGPEWRTEDAIHAEAWVTFVGRRCIFDFESFAPVRGG